MVGRRTDRNTVATLEWDGIYAALMAGAVLLFAEMLVAAMSGGGLMTPMRYAASIIMQERAFDALPLVPMIAGLMVHGAACAVFGFLYGLVASEESNSARNQWKVQIGIGALFGAVIWLVDFQLIARFFYPWFLQALPIVQLVLHVVLFGIPLALAYAYLRRRRALSPTGEITSEAVFHKGG